jgi:hypothetical protein
MGSLLLIGSIGLIILDPFPQDLPVEAVLGGNPQGPAEAIGSNPQGLLVEAVCWRKLGDPGE